MYGSIDAESKGFRVYLIHRFVQELCIVYDLNLMKILHEPFDYMLYKKIFL
jgi:hypothetical protein